MHFKVVGKIRGTEVIAVGSAIRDILHLRAEFGDGRWRKMKGIADVILDNGQLVVAELHWYEAHGIGVKRMKVKRVLSR